MKKRILGLIVGVFAVAAVGGLATSHTVLAAGGGTSLRGSSSGAGETVSSTFLANFNVGVFDNVESQTLTGDISGIRSTTVTERATFDLNTSSGTYHAIFEFDGSVAGRSCTGVIIETGSVDDLATGDYHGYWHFLYNDCGFESIQGIFFGNLQITSETDYLLTGKYRGFAK